MSDSILTQALAHHQAGRLMEAEQGYRAVLTTDPQHADALHLLGVLALQTGQPATAVELIGQALEREKGVADYWDNLGSALTAADRRNEAAQAHRNAILLNPQSATARHNLGNTLAALGRHGLARRLFASALALRPDYAKAWYNLGNSERALHRLDQAIAALSHAVRLAPGMTEAHTNLGDALADAGRLGEAAAQHRVAVSQNPDDANAHYNLGAILQQQGAHEGAEIAYREALRRNPLHPAALNNLGSVLKRLGRPDQAEICHRKALDLRPDFAEARHNLGNALQVLGRFKEAEECYEAALAQDPNLATATYNLGRLALLHGDLPRGWAGYERRFAAGEVRPHRRIDRPFWGGEGLRGRRLLVWREQGVGDEILFASCYPDLLAASGGPVTIECDARLVPLFTRSFPKATVRAESCTAALAETIEPPDFDLQVPAGSLPFHLRNSLPSFGPQAPWLVPDPARLALWRERLARLGPGLRVGVAWRSQLVTEERRSAYTSLDQWGAILAVPGIRFVNLQYGECSAELNAAEARFGVRIHRWSDLDLKNDFEGAAALTANLDLVISPAMSAGELAGALGVPVWRFGGRDWTQLGSGVRPWFPSMRLFQPRPGETLQEALDAIARALRAAGGIAADAVRTPRPDTNALLSDAIDRHRAGRLEEARAGYQAVIDAEPGHADALHLLGLIHHQCGQPEEAEGLMADALRRVPDFPAAWNHLGLVQDSRGQPDAALRSFTRALALRPDFPEALTHLGLRLQRSNRPADAKPLHRRSIMLVPDNPAPHTNLGHACESEGCYAEAAIHYRRAVALRPEAPDTQNNLATVANLTGRAADTALHLRRALRLDPDFALAAWNFGLLALANGDITAGWAGYRKRFSARQLQRARRIPRPEWHGEALEGRRLLVWSEQGVGDEILFASCFDALKGLDGPVTLECDRRLVSLFARAFPWVSVRAETVGRDGGETVEPPDCDLQVAAGGLPALFRNRLAAFPQRDAYLAADPARVAFWRERLAALGPGLKVGLGWRSQLVTAQRRSAYTSLEDWEALLDLPGVVAVNLQYGDCTAELSAVERGGRRLHRWHDLDLKDDFEGVAALMTALDLVISPAMSAGELAGALGVPVWRLGGRDWTQLGSGVRPWFPSMRLIQPRPGEDMAAAVTRAIRALAALSLPFPSA
ncbi:tetratricopeptide repeat protein [Azospirillum agricola]|uniref:tetratricopeptide repeat protein n=1 Tax=Azospirillum agricola TaxID=1720247 RepID=UPI000A0EFCCC|nr:tetratricopeptide repeat protein [Azospirillum agricola]SMH45426.1 Tetratricopeptide (TPR) repeat [Azospirillum lipoferum]